MKWDSSTSLLVRLKYIHSQQRVTNTATVSHALKVLKAFSRQVCVAKCPLGKDIGHLWQRQDGSDLQDHMAHTCLHAGIPAHTPTHPLCSPVLSSLPSPGPLCLAGTEPPPTPPQASSFPSRHWLLRTLHACRPVPSGFISMVAPSCPQLVLCSGSF